MKSDPQRHQLVVNPRSRPKGKSSRSDQAGHSRIRDHSSKPGISNRLPGDLYRPEGMSASRLREAARQTKEDLRLFLGSLFGFVESRVEPSCLPSSSIDVPNPLR